MTEVKAAKIKLEKALNRLEKAVDSMSWEKPKSGQAEAGSADSEVLESNMATLRAEKDDLARRLSSISADYSALERVVDEVSARLDATIGKLRGILDK